MIYFQRGNKNDSLTPNDLNAGLCAALDTLGTRQKVLAIPPDITRFYSRAGELTEFAWKYYGKRLTDILPALGTHFAMTDAEIDRMFGAVPHDLFRVHDWRNDVVTLGEVPADYLREVSEGKIDFTWPAQVNRLLVESGFDLILSVGQVVPHEVIGMANYNKNIFVGTGGGRSRTPVRSVLNYASDHFAKDLPIVYVLTVIEATEDGQKVRGLFIGDDVECFEQAAALSLKVNFQMLDEPLNKVVVYLEPHEFKSTWLGNKSIYRTRMAMANGGELIVLASGLKEFGEDKEIDRLIRKYGYVGTPKVLELTKQNQELQNNLSAAAHLIHGSTEGRFSVTYCPGHLTKDEIESVNFAYADLDEMIKRYDPHRLKDGFNTVDGEEIFYISNPGMGLWSWKERFK
ncbi:MAG: lactate racemase domain-containing protein [Planctomycetota bacterium]|jgi:nickel-dependent lactate racemase